MDGEGKNVPGGISTDAEKLEVQQEDEWTGSAHGKDRACQAKSS